MLSKGWQRRFCRRPAEFRLLKLWCFMPPVEAAKRETIISELKRLITARSYASLDELEDAVDTFLWQGEKPEVQGAAASPASPA